MEQELKFRKKLFKVVGYGPVCGDQTCDIYLQLLHTCTVQELCDYILVKNTEWGRFELFNNEDCFVEYSKGKYIGSPTKFPPHIANASVKEVYAHGGWGNMDYIIKI